MEFPKEKSHPSKLFKRHLYPRGVGLSFSNGNYKYELYSDPSPDSLITVTKDGGKPSQLKCGNLGADTDLSMTPVMKLLEGAGIPET